MSCVGLYLRAEVVVFTALIFSYAWLLLLAGVTTRSHTGIHAVFPKRGYCDAPPSPLSLIPLMWSLIFWSHFWLFPPPSSTPSPSLPHPLPFPSLLGPLPCQCNTKPVVSVTTCLYFHFHLFLFTVHVKVPYSLHFHPPHTHSHTHTHTLTHLLPRQ